jgi:hypothetical protein
MTQFFRTLFKFLPPLRRTLGATPRGLLLVYSDAQYSQRGRKGLGVVVTDTLTNTSKMCGGEVPDDILAWMDRFGSRKKQKINQCELLAVIAAVMTFVDILNTEYPQRPRSAGMGGQRARSQRSRAWL